MELVEKLSTLLTFLISLGTVATVTLPKLRKKMTRWIAECTGTRACREEIGKLKELVEEVARQEKNRTAEMKLQKEVDKCVLRDLITGIYYQYASEKKLPIYMLENVTALHDLYRKRGGNSYVQNLFEQMTEEWEIES